MKVHSDTLSPLIMHHAAVETGVTLEKCVEKGSRKRKRGFEFSLSGSSNRRPNSGRNGADDDRFAATWDEWGMFLNRLFEADPNATMTYYEDQDDFRWQTDRRFDTLKPADQCRNHKWEYDGTVATGSYSVHSCTKCLATRRHRIVWR